MYKKILYPSVLDQAKNTVLILSGGLDSGVLLRYLNSKAKSVYCLSFHYGSKHNDQELSYAKSLAEKYGAKHEIVDLPFVNRLFSSSLLSSGAEIPEGHYEDQTMRSTVVPFRNAIMLSIAVGYAESNDINTVLLGSHAGDHAIYPDCRPEFTQAFAQAASLGTYNNVQVVSPFNQMDKREIADLGRSMQFDFLETWTCYKGGQTHCGLCGSCQERKYALRHEQGLDPTIYEN